MGKRVLALVWEMEFLASSPGLLICILFMVFFLWGMVGVREGLVDSLSLSFFICKLKMIIPIAQGHCEEHKTLCTCSVQMEEGILSSRACLGNRKLSFLWGSYPEMQSGKMSCLLLFHPSQDYVFDPKLFHLSGHF